METLYNALLGELVGRSISFLVSRYGSQPATAAAAVREEHLQRLRLLLLRTGTIVEEAEGRHVANRAALRRQLEALRDEMFRGHHVLDIFRYHAGRRPAGGVDASRRVDGDGKEAMNRARVFDPSRSNPAKRVRRLRLSPDDDDPELERVVLNLEAMVGDTKELVVFLMSCPPLHRQPYSAHIFVDKCMFGRHAERDRVIEFLLQSDPPDAANPGVLPIIGPALIGKSTLVEHVCNDERVRNCFSLILFYTRNELEYETITSFMDNCVIRHKSNDASGDERWLIVIELSGDVDDGTWKRLYSSGRRCMAKGSKLIVTSRSEKIARFGTTHSLRLKCLSMEAFWYYFKLLVFGSTDPDEHPKLASIAMEMAVAIQGSFIGACICAAIMRVDFDTQYWCMILKRVREYMQKNLILFGEYPDDLKAMDQPRYTWSMVKPVPDEYFLLYGVYQRGVVREDALPKVTVVDLMTGRAQKPRGRFEVLYWKSAVPPYFSYICPCEVTQVSDM